ncbi:BnaCnng33400D [Brassica napus]|nr:unnamed protein product [Brassica napus]CDY58612.1 BnaCnng33400D [Brassica napus]
MQVSKRLHFREKLCNLRRLHGLSMQICLLNICLTLRLSTPVNLRPPRSHPGASLPPPAEEFCQHTVIGIDRLRVIDMSTVGYCPGTNPQATVMMLGRYKGVKIMRERETHQ